ncbi:MAG: PqqD family protein [Dehalococcoidia bacterium]|nr:PqqD family protein [Dehalococcoidia bacterium]
MTAPTAPAVLSVSPSVLAQEVGTDIVILDLDSGMYFSANEVGAHIWKGLERGDGLETIETALMDQFEAPEGQLARDIESFVSALIDRGLVVAR